MWISTSSTSSHPTSDASMEEPQEHISPFLCGYNPCLEDAINSSAHESIMGIFEQCNQMPFLQMLQEPSNIQLLLRLEEERLRPPESCITQVSEPIPHDKNRAPFPKWPAAAVSGLKVVEEKRKRKRRRAPRKVEAASESQRMSHIAVERNRRKVMNEHLAELRSLMPSSYIQRGDQASVVGGAIDLVKELEQQLQNLQAERHDRFPARLNSRDSHPFDCFFISPQYRTYSCQPSPNSSPMVGSVKAEHVEGTADVEATVVQTHVNLRVFMPRRPGQLARAVAVLESLHLIVLHLNVASFHDSVLYSFNLKMEEDCKLISADEIATVVHHMFTYVSSEEPYSQ